MKSVKLKPIFFPNDDILVKPPDFLQTFKNSQSQSNKFKTFSNTDQLKNLLKIRNSKKKPNTQEEEEEIVKKLEDWHAPETTKSPKTPLIRKFTFRKGATSFPENKESLRSNSINLNLFNIPETQNIASVFRGIVAVERLKKKNLEVERKRVTETNLQLEQEIRVRINKAKKELEGCKAFIKENSEKSETTKSELETFEKSHEDQMYEISLNEATDLLLSEKGKKRVIKPGDESQYFIQKEKFRQLKQNLHKHYHDHKESLTQTLRKIQQGLSFTRNLKTECKSNLRIYKEELVHLYCRILKDGKDIRSDGLRWIIKSLWKMGECVPISAFPKFFDDDSCFFLLQMAEKDLELEKVSTKLEDLRKELRSRGKSFDIRSTRELYKTVKSRLRNISQSSVGENLDGSGGEWVGVGDEIVHGNGKYGEIGELRGKIGEIKEFVKEVSDLEIKRITECYQKAPGEAEKVGLFHLIKCFVGDKVREFNKYTRSGKARRTKAPALTGILGY